MRMNLETEEQMVIYDFSAIVAGVGGSLGLFLGFSCYEAFKSSVDKLTYYWESPLGDD